MFRALLAPLSGFGLLVATPILIAQSTLVGGEVSAPSFALWVWALAGLAALVGMMVFGLTVGRPSRSARGVLAAGETAVVADPATDLPGAARYA